MLKKLIFLLILCCSVWSLPAQNNAVNTYSNPVIGGDIPDPTVIRVGDDYFAAGTSHNRVPMYPLYHSKDLINWEKLGGIFNEPPAWIQGACWAPELFYNDGIYYVYYTAKRKSDGISCIGVATSTDPRNGFKDHGMMVETGNEAIDAFVFKDDDGKLYFTWKAYGLDPTRPIEILISEMSPDGLSLVGKHWTLSNFAEGWIGRGEEGQVLLKRKDYYYHFYSVGGCCDNRCTYEIRVARSKSLRGPWEQYEVEPLLCGNELWRCSGHGTIVQTQDGRYFYMYHAYQAHDFEYVGRQALLDEMLWDDRTGWPYMKYGNSPTAQAPVPFKGTVQQSRAKFYDPFLDHSLDKWYQWELDLARPKAEKKDGVMTMKKDGEGLSILSKTTLKGNYAAETAVLNASPYFKGIAVYSSPRNIYMIGTEGDAVKVYHQTGRERIELYSEKTGGALPLYLKIEATGGRLYRFMWSADGKNWKGFPEGWGSVDGSVRNFGSGISAGMIIDGPASAEGKFQYFSITTKY